MEIVNIVATVEMEKSFDLEELLDKLPDCERANVWVKARIPPYNKYTAFYGSGKFLITGSKSEKELNDYDASYEPEQFPGMNFKDNHGLSYLLFGSGKITITGVKSLDNFEEYVNEFKELIFEKSVNNLENLRL